MDVPSPLEPLPPYFTIGRRERFNVNLAMNKPLSGYLGGIPKGGYWVEKLADSWASTLKVKHAVPCNSATSGLLAACMAIGIGPGDVVWTPATSMSATAACAKVLGATIVFCDIETTRYSINMNNFGATPPKAIIVTNLFGHPAHLASMRSWCNSNKVWLIEDSAQALFATENDQFAGTIGHIGVFSLNVHKHLQSGEGGVAVTNDTALAQKLRAAINHGELGATGQIGLNLRMTEPVAAIACAQLEKAARCIGSRVHLAKALTDMFSGVSWLIPPRDDTNCTSVYYIWAARVLEGRRQRFLRRLWDYQFPMRKGYSPVLNRVFNSNVRCPVAESMEDEEMITFEVCAYDPRTSHYRQMKEIARWTMEM